MGKRNDKKEKKRRFIRLRNFTAQIKPVFFVELVGVISMLLVVLFTLLSEFTGIPRIATIVILSFFATLTVACLIIAAIWEKKIKKNEENQKRNNENDACLSVGDEYER